jgi:hypothetical protein
MAQAKRKIVGYPEEDALNTYLRNGYDHSMTKARVVSNACFRRFVAVRELEVEVERTTSALRRAGEVAAL